MKLLNERKIKTSTVKPLKNGQLESTVSICYSEEKYTNIFGYKKVFAKYMCPLFGGIRSRGFVVFEFSLV